MARERSSPVPALAASVTLHAVILIGGLIAWPWLNPPMKIGQVVPVTLMTSQDMGSLRNTEAAPVPAPAATETPTPDAPVQTPAPAPAPTPAKAAPAPSPAPSKPAPSPTPSKTKPAKADKSLDLDALAASLNTPNKSAGGRQSSAMKGPNHPATSVHAQTTNGMGDVAASGALASLGAELQRVWNVNCDVPGGAPNLVVTIRIGASGRLIGEPQSTGDNGSDLVRIASERAKAAVRALEPFKDLPPQFYTGQAIALRFDGKQACAGR